MQNYKIDDKQALNLKNAADQQIYKSLSKLIDNADTAEASNVLGIEYKASLLPRLKPQKLITDNNMGNEWQ